MNEDVTDSAPEDTTESQVGALEAPVRLSLMILLPEALDRRFAKWAAEMPGASWPTFGGHITLVSSFVPRTSVDEVIRRATAVGQRHPPFEVRLRAPVAIQDVTRPDYHAVFLTAHDDDSEHHHLPDALRADLLEALADIRTDVRQELKMQAFIPHITLALSLGKDEAELLVRAIRTHPLEAEFHVEVFWVLEQTQVEGQSKSLRHPIGLGRVVSSDS